MADEIKIDLTVTVDSANKSIKKFTESASKSIESVTSSLKRFSNSVPSDLFSSFGSNALKTFGKIRSAIFSIESALFALGAGAFLSKAISEANEYETSLFQLQGISRRTGIALNELQIAVKELSSDGLIPAEDVVVSLRNLLQTGIGIDQAVSAFKKLRDVTAFNRKEGISLSDALKNVTLGIRNQNSKAIESAGITQKLSVIQKEYAASIGKTVSQLSQQEIRQATLNGVLQSASQFQGDYSRLLNTFSGRLAQSREASNNFAESFGLIITQSPFIIKAIQIFSETVSKLETIIINNKDVIRDFIESAIIGFASLAKSVVKSFTAIAEVFTTLQVIGLEVRSFFDDSAEKTTLRIKQLEVEIQQLSKNEREWAVEKRRALSQEIERLKIIGNAQDDVVTKEELALSRRLDFFNDINKSIDDQVSAFKNSAKEVESTAKKLKPTITVEVEAEIKKPELILDKKKLADVIKAALETPFTINLDDENISKQFDSLLDEKSVKVNMGLRESIIEPLAVIGLDFSKNIQSGLSTFTDRFNSSVQRGYRDFFKSISSFSVDLKDVFKILVNSLRGASIFKGFINDTKKALADSARLLGDALIAIVGPLGPVIGESLAQIIDILGEAPEVLREKILKAFRELPKVLVNILQNAINFREILAEGILILIDSLPLLVEKTAELLILQLSNPSFWLRVAIRVAFAFVASIPQIIQGFIDGFRNGLDPLFGNFKIKISDSGKEFFQKVISGGDQFFSKVISSAEEFVKKLFESIKKFGKNSFGDVGGFFENVIGEVGGFIGSVGSVFGFAKGGIVPNTTRSFGRGTDRVPAMLSPGELVVPRSQVPSAINAISGNGNEITNSLLSNILFQLMKDQSVSTSINIDGRKLADAILQLNRNNARLGVR